MDGKRVTRLSNFDHNWLVFAAAETQRWQRDVRVAQLGEYVEGQLAPPAPRGGAYQGSSVVSQVVSEAWTTFLVRGVYVS